MLRKQKSKKRNVKKSFLFKNHSKIKNRKNIFAGKNRMKKLNITTVIVFLILSIFKVQSQEEKVSQIQGKNEIKLNGFYLALGVAEISYERILNNESAVGISVNFDLEENNLYNFGVIPYYRLYFGKKKAAGFFIEGNAAVIADDPRPCYDCFLSPGPRESKLYFGLGVAAGGKFISRKGWVGEIFIGIGRFFGTNEYYHISELYPRVGISFGKRF